MKAILVIDMPTDCIKCPLANGYCWNTFPTKERAVGCPLKPLPSKKDVTVKRVEDIQSYSITEVADKISAKIILKSNEIFALGWNACLDLIIGNDCLDEITGEKE